MDEPSVKVSDQPQWGMARTVNIQNIGEHIVLAGERPHQFEASLQIASAH